MDDFGVLGLGKATVVRKRRDGNYYRGPVAVSLAERFSEVEMGDILWTEEEAHDFDEAFLDGAFHEDFRRIVENSTGVNQELWDDKIVWRLDGGVEMGVEGRPESTAEVVIGAIFWAKEKLDGVDLVIDHAIQQAQLGGIDENRTEVDENLRNGKVSGVTNEPEILIQKEDKKKF